MASKGKASVIHVVICGLTSSSFQSLSGQGAGKSYLCNKFVRPKFDDLKEHTSVLNNSDFGSNIINQTHFLYWGEKVVGLEDGQDVAFQLVEQTEFVDDASLKPFTYTKPYQKRCTQLKLQSGGKVMYINNDQLALPEEYTNVAKFPDKFHVDGFIVCVDVSIPFDDPTNPQKEFFNRLFHAVQQSKKPVVVAMTKFDHAIDTSVASVTELVSKAKKQVPMIEVSASRGVNVDMCFLVLSHLVDPKKPKTKIVPYVDAKIHLDERIRKIETSFQSVLDRAVTDFALSEYQVCKELQSDVEFLLLLELKGIDRIHKLVRGQLAYLKKQQIEAKLSSYLELLPLILDAIIPRLSLNDNTESSRVAIKSSKKFSQYFADVSDWRGDTELLKSTNRDIVPFGLLSEDSGLEVLQKHIDKVLKTHRENVAFDKIRDILRNSQGLFPGTDQSQLWDELGVSEEASLISTDRLTKLYLEHMSEVEKECVSDLRELLMEKISLFDNEQENNQNTLDKIDHELKDFPRYKRFDRRRDVRKGQVLKHIGSVQVGERSSQSRSHVIETLEKLEEAGRLSKSSLRPPKSSVRESGALQWSLFPEGEEYFNLSVIARTLDNALTLRSDFMNHLTGNCLFESNGKSYHLDMSLFHSDDGPITTMTNKEYIPDGAVAVVNSMECLDWLEELVGRLWIPGGGAESDNPPYRGMPLVILALDKTAAADSNESPPTTPLHKRAIALASTVQSTCVIERPTEQPKRLVVSKVIIQLLSSLMEVSVPTNEFFNTELPLQDHLGLNIAVCTICDDPYPAMALLSPWLRHQAVYCNQGNQTLFVRSNLDKQLRTCTLTFHSALNVRKILSFTRLGFILVYSTSRPASLAVIKFLMSKLPNVPKMVVAIVSDKSHDNHMIEEGRELAQKWNAAFFSSSDEEWTIGYTSEFFAKCWFVRFTSWNCQDMPEAVVSKLRVKRQARALPTRPTFDRDQPLPLPVTRERHSIAFLDTNDDAKPPFSSGTIPRSPSKSKYTKPTSLPGPPVFPSASVDDMGIYSDPIASKIGIKQMKAATIDRKKSSTSSEHFLFPNSPPVLVSPTDANEDLPDNAFLLGKEPESEYASVEDALSLSGHKLPLSMIGTLERQRKGLKSPSMSPPPLPFSPPESSVRVLNGSFEEEELDDPNDLYATVQTKKKVSLPKVGRGYDHLEKSPEIVRKQGYDHLPPQIPPRSDSLLPDNPPESEAINDMYATVNKTTKRKKPAPPPPDPSELYSTVQKTHNRHKSADTSLQDVNALYSTVQKKPPAKKPKPPPRRSATPDEPPYSLPDKRVRGRQSPPTPPLGKKTPPTVAPKPRRSPTPTGPGRAPVLAHLRSESFDTGLSSRLTTRLPLLPDLRPVRSQSMDKRPLIKSPIISTRQTVPLEVDNRAASLPKSYRHRTGSGRGSLTRSLDRYDDSYEEDMPTLPERNYLPADLGLDDIPPPLPPRIYHWSDMEDNDDELFQSDDDLDEPMSKWSVSDQQKLYASITQATQRSPSVSGVEAIYHVVNKMVLVDQQADNSPVQVARQPSLTQEEESAYDTLENVIKTMRAERHTPFSPRTGDQGERGGATPEPNKMTSPIEKKPPPANQEEGLKSTPLTAAEIKNLQKTQKLLKKLEKQGQREAARRKAQEARKKKREEEEQRKKEGKKKGKKGKKQAERSRYFGSTLEQVVDSDGVPVFVKKCVEFVDNTGLKVEGIYRVPGKKENCLLLQDKFEEDQGLDLTTLGLFESAISSTLKAFFKLLPDPLIPNAVAAQILVVNSLDADSQKTRIHEILSTLSRPNLKTLKFVIQHLHRVQELQEINKMTPSNLSIVFWPTLMRPPLQDLADPTKRLGWQLIMTRIIEQPDFIPDVD